MDIPFYSSHAGLLMPRPEPGVRFRCYAAGEGANVPRELFELRHDVYCVERAFLDPQHSHLGMEQDMYDGCATHFAAHTVEGTLVGTVRLVTPGAATPYPFELHCRTFDELVLPARHQCAEVSRLALKRSHRRRLPRCDKGVPAFPDGGRNEFCSSLLLLGMYREMYRHSRARGVRYWFAAMERALARSLGTMGFRFDPIGPVANYYGKVTPYMADLHTLAPRLAQANPRLGAWFDEHPAAA